MDTTKPSAVFTSLSPLHFGWSSAELSEQLQSDAPPLVIDVRKNEAFLASTYALPGALRRDPQRVEHWALTFPTARTVLVAS